MKEWYTNAELAAFKLPDFPVDESGVWRWMQREDIDARFPNKVRRRKKTKGGGLERHVSVLPRSLQAILAVRDLKTAEAPALEQAFTTPQQQPDPEITERGHLRRDAILTILGLWDIFRLKFNGPTESARHAFATMYRTGRIEGLPGWVHEAMKTRDGRAKGLSVNTLRDWEAKRADGRLADLAGAWGNRKGTGILERAEDGKVAQYIAALIVKQPHLTSDHIRDLVRAEFGETLEAASTATGEVSSRPVPPVRTFRRFVAAWKETHAEALMKLTDPDGFKNKLRIAGQNMNHWVSRPNQLWEIDASRDLMERIVSMSGGRPRRICVNLEKVQGFADVEGLDAVDTDAWGERPLFSGRPPARRAA